MRRRRTSLRETPYFVGYNREAKARLPGPSRLYRRIQGEQIGCEAICSIVLMM